MQTTPFSDQLANVSPLWVVAIVLALTLVRIALSKSKDNWARTIAETCDTVNFVLILAFLLIRPFVAQAFYIPSESMQNTLLVKDRLIVNKFSYRLHEPDRHDVIVFEAPLEAGNGPGVDYIKRYIAKAGETVEVQAAKIRIGREEIGGENGGDVHDYLRDRLGVDGETAVKLFPDYVLIGGKDKIAKAELGERLGQPGAEIEITPGKTLINGIVQNEPYTREDPGYTFPNNNAPGTFHVDAPGPYQIPPGHMFMMGDNRNHSADSHAWGALDRRRVVGHAVYIFWPMGRLGAIK